MANETKHRELVLGDQVKEQMARDPRIAEVMREFLADFRNAEEAVARGQYDNLDEALAALGHVRLEDDDGE